MIVGIWGNGFVIALAVAMVHDTCGALNVIVRISNLVVRVNAVFMTLFTCVVVVIIIIGSTGGIDHIAVGSTIGTVLDLGGFHVLSGPRHSPTSPCLWTSSRWFGLCNYSLSFPTDQLGKRNVPLIVVLVTVTIALNITLLVMMLIAFGSLGKSWKELINFPLVSLS